MSPGARELPSKSDGYDIAEQAPNGKTRATMETSLASASSGAKGALVDASDGDVGQRVACSGGSADAGTRQHPDSSPQTTIRRRCAINNRRASQQASAFSATKEQTTNKAEEEEEQGQASQTGSGDIDDHKTVSTDFIKQNSDEMGPLLLNNKSLLEPAHSIRATADDVVDDDSNRLNKNIAKQETDNDIVLKPPMASNANERKIPQRKTSVFSLNGFPNIQMLDQQNLKIREDVAAASQEAVGDRFQSVFDDDKQLEGEQAKAPNQGIVPVLADSKSRRLVRQNTLGSTGSSRASSCDEPTIVTISSSASRGATSAAGREIVGGTSTNSGGFNGCQADGTSVRQGSAAKQQCEVSSDTQPSSSSSTCSLDSIGWPATSNTINQQTHQTTEKSFKEALEHPEQEDVFDEQEVDVTKKSALIPPPFESIKDKLERNSKPNAQLIQRHIDDIISHNEAIIDNWNLVSIRPYNSNNSQRDCSSCKRASSSSCEHDRLPRESLSEQPDRQQVESNLNQTRQARSKRWSTTSMLTASNGSHQPLVSSSSSSSSNSGMGSTSTGYSSLSSNGSICQQQQAGSCDATPSKIDSTLDPIALARQQTERKRSYNLARKISTNNLNHGLPEFVFARTGNPFAPERPGSIQPYIWGGAQQSTVRSASSQVATDFGSATHLSERDHLSFQMGQHGDFRQSRAQEPVHLENAIENLSLRRIEDESQHDRSRSMQYLGSIEARTNAVSTPFALNRWQPNLVSGQYRQSGDCQEQQIAMAALLTDRQRQQSLMAANQQMDFEGRAAILHQEQMIEQEQQQLEQLRLSQHLAASIEQRSEHQVALASAVANGSISAYMAAQHLLQLQNHHHLLATHHPNPFDDNRYNHPLSHPSLQQSNPTCNSNYLSEHQALESHFLRNFLSQVMSDRDREHEQQNPQQQQQHSAIGCNLGHGAELLTQSLDSGKPAHRCDACDISFWTKDLLSYHILTQCTARFSPAQSRPPLAFNFAGPQSGSFDQIQSLQKQLSKSVSPPKRSLFGNSSKSTVVKHASEVAHEGTIAEDANLTLINCPNTRKGFSPSWKSMSNDISILKQQLLTMPNNVPHDTLPFKKRKISEPIMRY